MKTMSFFKTVLLMILALICATIGVAQEAKPPEGPPPQEKRPPAIQPHDTRADILHQLGLSDDQIQQIRSLNIEKRPLMDEAQKRFREANRALDEAIYADQVNEADVQARLTEVQLAQAEVAKLRFMNELAVRRILTQEQLVRFRELRQRFEKVRREFENRRQFKGDRHINRQHPVKGINTPKDGQPPVKRVVSPNVKPIL